MSQPINYLVVLIVAIIVLIAVVIFLFTGQLIGGDIGLQNQLRMCCSKFTANNCDWSLETDIICDEENFKSFKGLRTELNMDENQVEIFCGC